MPHVYSWVAFVLPILAQVPDKVDALQTVAERSDYRVRPVTTMSRRGVESSRKERPTCTSPSWAARRKGVRSR